ncbi:General substrate transporter [Akanthomyces lecanii RCEF 1005]|uniref:General substrate transporter n=1 Tax=Akanthomyces lecanii RCEF 1005 TaxID=1081108 RepID=A0A162IQZ7_CORDF|nr:General substrate transporter [Akanthomyces lecanii RCEF 1005]
MLFGYDTASFGGILANPGFVRQFGAYNSQKKTYAFDSFHVSLLSSLPFIGKFIGCLVAGPAIEKFGHRSVFFALSVVSVIGIIVELTAAGTGVSPGHFAQFLAGRVIVYISVGLVEVNITTYQAEIVPAPFRGFVVISLQLFLNAGTVLATGVNKAFANVGDSVGWKTVTGVQFVFPVLISAFTFFIPSSPRWLLSKDREEEAVVSLRRLRTKADAFEGRCDAEVQEIKEALRGNVQKAPWADLIHGNNLRRTMIVVVYYFFQQMGGASIPYLLGSEIPNAALREKTQSLGTSWNVLWGFATNYSIPYIIAKINFQVGWVFGSIALLALIFTIFVLPETKGASLEEMDAIFEVAFNPFRPNNIHAKSRLGHPERDGGLPVSMSKNDDIGSKDAWVEAAHV